MKGTLSLLFVISLTLSTLVLIPGEVIAPSGPTGAPLGPHYMEPNPEVYDTTPFKQNPPMLGSTGRTRGPLTNDVIVLLIEFVGKTHQASKTAAYMDTLMNGMSQGNLRHYYSEVSNGSYLIQATIGGTRWFQSTRTMDWYGTDSTTGYDDYNGPIYNLVTEAVNLANPFVDFSNFDQDSDGVVDHLIVVHAGNGQEDSKVLSDIWSHRWAVVSPSLIVDGVRVYGYTIVSESSPIGVIAHEFGHDLGLPDLYNTDTGGPGVGVWDLMATGSWNGPLMSRGTNPAHPGAWCKLQLGWVQAVDVTTAIYGAAIGQVETTHTAFKLPVRESAAGDEYFLIENRQKTGYDSNLPGAGLLIWHIDESQPDNTRDTHRLVDLEQADEAFSDSPDDAGDAWSDSYDGFSPDSNPNSNGYGNLRTGWKVYDIGASGQIMTADISKVVDDDMAIIDVVNTRSVAVGRTLRFVVEVANLGGRNQTGIPVNMTIYLNDRDPDQIIYSRSQSFSLVSKAYINLTWYYSPPSEGRYIAEVRTILEHDQIPENNYRLTHFNAMSAYFFDDVEAGNKGWTASPTGEMNEWRIVNRSEYAGDAMSPYNSWRFGYFGGINNVSPLYSLESPSIAYQAGPLYLSFFHRYTLSVPGDTKIDNTDVATVKVSFNGGPWSQLQGANFTNLQTEWIFFSFDLSSYASSSGVMRIRFDCTAGRMPTDGGWWIDDVFVSSYAFGPAVSVVPIDTAQTVDPGDKAAFLFKVVNVGDYEDNFTFIVTSQAGWIVGLSHSANPPASPESVVIRLRSDQEIVFTLTVQTPGDVPRGTEETFTLTTRSATSSAKRDSFDAVVTINDPLGLARLSRYFILIIVVFVVLIAISLIIDSRKRRRGIR